MDTLQQTLHSLKKKVFVRPPQIPKKQYGFVRFAGRTGYFFKGFVYAFIGGLFVRSAVSTIQGNESPQGVFIFLGSQPDVSGYIYLSIILTGLLIYSTWRFWEGLTGQGYSKDFSKSKNFFKYRLSPLVSGSVYLAYSAYIIDLLQKPKAPQNDTETPTESCFPVCWKTSVIGKVGIGLLALAFSIAVITQLAMGIGWGFYNELDLVRLREFPFFKWVLYITGVIGFTARALLFAMIALLFWQVLFTDNVKLDPHHSTVAQALDDIRGMTVGKVIMFLLGCGLLIYGLFAVLSIYFKVFPTRPVEVPNNDVDPNVL